MKKITVLFVFIIGFSLTAFTQLSNYEFREGVTIGKKQKFKAPVIRIGVLSTNPVETAVETIEQPMPDTQAIYMVTVEVDSAYIVKDFAPQTFHTSIDTIQKIGNKIYNLGLDKNITDSDENWEDIQNYIVANTYTYDLDSMSADIVGIPDTQIFYILTEKVDSVLVINDPISLEQTVITDSVTVDTFYQIGATIFQDDLASSIEEDDWKIIREELIRDSVININLEDLTYEEYLDAELSKAEDIVVVETAPTFQPIFLKEEVPSPKTDTIATMMVPSPSQKDSFSTQTTILNPTYPVNNNSDLEVVNSRLLEMEKKLDAIRVEQVQQTNKTLLNPEPTPTPVPAAPAVPSAEIMELQKKIELLEAQTAQKSDPELEKMKQQLSLFEQQNKEKEKIDLQNRITENENLKAENAALRNNLIASQARTETLQKPVESNETSPDVKQLKSEMASMNQNMEMMKQLLLQQQVIASLKSQTPAPVAIPVPVVVPVQTKDTTTNNELIALKAEITELKTSIAVSNSIPRTKTTTTIDNNVIVIDTLKKQISYLEKELKALKEVEPPAPIIETVVVEKTIEKPVEKPVDVADIIKGREKQIVFFKIGGSQLSAQSFQQVAAIAQLMLQYDQLKIVLEAYTDSSGDAAKNLLLSKKRAESVRASLLQYGVSANRISMDYRGEDTQSDQDPAFGRRVEMILKAEQNKSDIKP